MPVDDSLHRGESYAGTWNFLRGGKALEGPEKAARIARVEPGAVVAHEEREFAVLSALAEFDPGTQVAGGVLPGIAKQVFQRRSHQLRISHGVQVTFNHELYTPVRLRFPKLRGDRLCHGAQV